MDEIADDIRREAPPEHRLPEDMEACPSADDFGAYR